MLICGVSLLVIGLVVFLSGGLILRLDKMKRSERTLAPKIAVLIPARDESAVLDGLLWSLEKQTMRADDVYVILESMDDPAVKICEQYQTQIILRKDLTKQRKGYALDDAVKEILRQNKHYDLYYIFDADNRLAEDFIERMTQSYMNGYDMAIGYRAARNANYNVISAVSSMTFTMINVLGNHKRKLLGSNIIFSGTGCFVAGRLVEEWGGWPFHSLTEDYEMSLYAILSGIKTDYNESAVFFDEQPTKYSVTVDQRVRWIKGYFMARKEFVPLLCKKLRNIEARINNFGSILKEIIGVWPLILMIIGAVLIVIDGLIVRTITISGSWVWLAFGMLMMIYLALMVVTIIMMKRERQKLRKGLNIKVLFYNPIFLLSYIPCAIQAVFKRKVDWKKIPHGK